MKSKIYWILFPLLGLTLILVPPISVNARPGHDSPNPASDEFIEKVNALRASKGLPPYRTNPILIMVAQDHAVYISSTGVLTHFDGTGRRSYQRAIDAGYSVAGDLSTGGLFMEVIYSGAGISDDDVISAWQANSADAAALISPVFEDVGVGIAAANGKTYYVLVAGLEGASTDVSVSPTISTGTAAGISGVPNTPSSGGEIYHVVQKNEALWSIALLYGTTIVELKQLNNLSSDEIFEGQKLLVRRANTETPTPTLAPVTATLGIPTSTATQPVTPTITMTPTSLPAPPTNLQNGGMVAGGIILAALLAAGLFSILGNRREKSLD